jgi:hypothetical protein
MIFKNPTGPFVPMLVKDVSNTRSAKTYYINRLKHKKRKMVITATLLHSWLTNQLTFCSHVTLAPITTVVNCIFLSSNILFILLYIIEWKLKNLNKSNFLTTIESVNRTVGTNFAKIILKTSITKCIQFRKSGNFFLSVIEGLTKLYEFYENPTIHRH